jgi:V/A-type H+-transporting ATPase subunit D
MSGRAIRSRLQELRQAREAAERGRDVLEQKLELLRREWERRRALREEAARQAETKLRLAREALRLARIDLGRLAVDAAALAQPAAPAVEWRWERLAGVRLPALATKPRPFRAAFGTGGSSASLDAAAAGFSDAYAALVALSSHEAAVAALRRATLRTLCRVNALDHAVLPQIRRELREIAAALEEDEREESSRRKAWMELRPA